MSFFCHRRGSNGPFAALPVRAHVSYIGAPVSRVATAGNASVQRLKRFVYFGSRWRSCLGWFVRLAYVALSSSWVCDTKHVLRPTRKLA